jgi:diguanylate cyclase (GGDEF)-like protein
MLILIIVGILLMVASFVGGFYIASTPKYSRFFKKPKVIIVERTFTKAQVDVMIDVYTQINNKLTESQKELEATNKDLEFKVQERTKRLEELSNRDPLTNLYNRRHFNERMEQELQRAKRFNLNLSIIYIDVDHFKNYNDTNGHPKGDVLLEQFAVKIKSTIRTIDVPCRIGGEEFCIILPETDHNGAMVTAEKVRLAVEQTEFYNQEKQPKGRVTCSLGVSEFPNCAADVATLIDAADKALYQAKESGRNKAVLASQMTKDRSA